jgi:hypothetical protein
LAAPADGKRPRAAGILLAKRPREPKNEIATANSAKPQGFEARPARKTHHQVLR